MVRKPSPDATVRILDGFITIVGADGTVVGVTPEGKLMVSGSGGGGGGGTVDQGESGSSLDPWFVTDTTLQGMLALLAGFLGASAALLEAPLADGDDQAPATLLTRATRLYGWDEAGGDWDRLRKRFGGLEARDDYAEVSITHLVMDPAEDNVVLLPDDTRLVRVTNWSISQRVLVRFDGPVVDIDDPVAARVGVAPVSNVSNSEVWPVRQTTVHVWAAGGAEVTVEAFRGP